MSLKTLSTSKPVLGLALVVGQFMLFEAGLRFWGGSEAAPEFQRLFMTDPRIGHRLRPGAETRFKTAGYETDIAINRAGVRDDELGPKRPDERRIAVLGDSIVLAVQVPLRETFCKRLEERLNQTATSGGIRYRVINAGVQGYGPVEDYLFFKHVVMPLEPDLVLIGLYVGNDAIEAAQNAGRLAADGERVAASTARETAYAWARRIVRRSMVLQILRLRVITLLDHFGRAPEIAPPLRTNLPTPPPEVVDGLAVTRDCVSRIADLAATRGAQTAVLLLPARFQIDDEDFGYLQEQVRAAGDTLLRDKSSERFAEALRGLRVPIMDARPPLRAAAQGGRVYFADTAHLTARGHQALADAIAPFLAASGLIAALDGGR